jgi:hypothetical protein
MKSIGPLPAAAQAIVEQLHALVLQLTDTEFVTPAQHLHGATIGQHLRHTLEFFTCFEKGTASGVVNYDQRDHDLTLETSRGVALACMATIQQFLAAPAPAQTLHLEVSYAEAHEPPVRIATNYQRELAYNIEHAVHHMALIKIGLKEVAPHIAVARNFGVAVSTLRHQQASTALAG